MEITKREITVLGDWESMRNLSFYTMDGKEPSYKHEGMCGEAEALTLNCSSRKFVSEEKEKKGEETYL